MINEKKILLSLNTDDDPRLIGQDEYVNCENINIGKSEFGLDGRIENMPSTSLLYNTVPSGENLIIGTATDYGAKRVFYFNWNSTREDGIYCYDFLAKTTYIVLLSSQVQGGLNFDKGFRIDRNARVVGGLLIFTDNKNEPKEINIEAGIKLNQPSYVTYVAPYATPIPYTTITLIKRPPIFNLSVTKITDAGFTGNFIQNNAYQFLYYYQYKCYEDSAMSAFSDVVIANFSTDTYNGITVKMQFAESIDDYVQSVNICVRYGNTGKTFIIKTYDKKNRYDAIAIESHNAGTVQLGFTFYDDISGIAVDEVFANTSFDNVPLISKTYEIAKDRNFLANNISGYNTPEYTTLYAAPVIGAPAPLFFKTNSTYRIAIAFFDRYRRKCGIIYSSNIITIPSRDFSGIDHYGINWGLNNSGAVNQIPIWAYYYQIHINKGTKDFFIQTLSNNASYIIKGENGDYDFTPIVFSDTNTYALAINISALNLSGQGYTFSEGDYVDIYNESGGVYSTIKVIGQTGNYVLLKPLDIGILYNTYVFKMRPGSSYVLADTDMPGFDLLQSYSEDGLSSKSSTSGDFPPDTSEYNFNIYDGVSRTFNITGALKIKAESNSSSPFRVQLYGLRNDTGASINYGDISNSISSLIAGTTYTFTINATVTTSAVAQRIYIVLFSIDSAFTYSPISGDIYFGRNDSTRLIEIYTPRKSYITDTVYESTDVFKITNPTMPNRTYSVTNGSLRGDTVELSRTFDSIGFTVESMSPNDNAWTKWERQLGWTNFIDTIGQTEKNNIIQYSNTYIVGSKNNGLNKFLPLNTKDIGSSSGSIQKLQLTNKQQVDGTVMLVITENDHLSAYLSETQLVAAAANDGSPIQSTEVIGTINALKNGFGTINPESVVEYLGTVWGVSVLSGVVWQYSNNGVTAISDLKMKRFFDRYCKRYIQQGQSAIEALCGFSYISGAVDVTKREYIFTLPQVETNAVISGIPVGFAQPLPSYSSLPPYASSIQNRFDIYDGNAKTMAYKYEENKWRGVYEWLPDCMAELGNRLVGFKNGASYLFNENASVYNTIFGVQYPQRICFVVNSNPSAIKDIRVVGIEGNTIPKFSVFYSEYPNIQISDLADTDTDIQGNLLWQNKEGVQYASVLRDRLSPNVSGTADEKLRTGDLILSPYTFVMLEWREYNNKLIINFVNISYEVSRGHNFILPQTKQ